MSMITLHNVRDIRDDRVYSIVIVKANKAKWFVPVEPKAEPVEEPEEE